MELLEQALGILGPNARLYAALGHAWWQCWDIGARMDETVRAKAEDYAGRALALEPGCPQAHVVFGLFRGMTNPVWASRTSIRHSPGTRIPWRSCGCGRSI